jgi:hypothetical protein
MTKLDTGLLRKLQTVSIKHDARKIFHEGGEITGKTPETLITDG